MLGRRDLMFISLLLSFFAFSAGYADPEMVTVPAGTFLMGDGHSFCGETLHEVTLTRDFQLGRYEVTNQEYMEAVQWAYDNGYVTVTTTNVLDNLDGSTEALLKLTNYGSQIVFDGAGTFYLTETPYGLSGYPQGYDPSQHPVLEVTWYGAARYCDWLSLQAGLTRAYEHSGDWLCNGGDPYGAEGYRLPTDAEWEYAAQWDDEREFPWGNEAPDCNRLNFRPYPDCVGWTSPVGNYPEAPASLGLSDMAGNVWEWCNDWLLCDLGTSPATDPVGGPASDYRVYHGGSWSHAELYQYNAGRYANRPYYGIENVGLRIARTIDTSDVGDQSRLNTAPKLLEANRPNPFIRTTQIRYALPSSESLARVSIQIYDPAGRWITTLVDSHQGAGRYSATWDGRNPSGEPVAPGVYFINLQWNGMSETKRLILVR